MKINGKLLFSNINFLEKRFMSKITYVNHYSVYFNGTMSYKFFGMYSLFANWFVVCFARLLSIQLFCNCIPR